MPLPVPRLGWLRLIVVSLSLGYMGMQHSTVASEHIHVYSLQAAIDHVDTRHFLKILEKEDGERYILDRDLLVFGFALPAVPPYRHEGEVFYPVSLLPDIKLHIDRYNRRVHLLRIINPHLATALATDLLVDIRANGRKIEHPQLIQWVAGELILPAATLTALGIKPEQAGAALQHGGLPLHAVAGENFSIDLAKLSLDVTLNPENFSTNIISATGRPRLSAFQPTDQTSVFLNYDLTLGWDDKETNSWQSGLFELVGARETTTCLSRHLVSSNNNSGIRRLDSYCTYDWPESMQTLILGDAIARPGAMGQAIRYGGIRYGRDFGLMPGFITQPSLQLEGTARVPSTLEVWIDQMLTMRTLIPAGPFAVTDIPTYTGSGEMRAIVQDAFGRVQVVTQAFYSDPILLAPGLSDWSAEFGFTREGYGSERDSYTDLMVIGSWRKGLSDSFTAEARLETHKDFQSMAGNGVWRIGESGVLEFGAGFSHLGGATGKQWLLGFSRRGKTVSLGMRYRGSDEAFIQLGYEQPGEAPKSVAQINIGGDITIGTLNLSAYHRRDHDDREQAFVSTTLSIPISWSSVLFFNAQAPVKPEGSLMVSAHLVIPFGDTGTLSTSVARHRSANDYHFSLQRNLPAGSGWGYRVGANRQSGKQRNTSELNMQNSRGTLSLAVDQDKERVSWRTDLRGSIVAVEKGYVFSRWQDESYGIVQLPATGVRVYREGLLIGQTDENGFAVVPGLRAYDRNRVSIAIEDLPLDAAVATDSVEIVPGRRQGVMAPFKGERSVYVTFHLLKADGNPVPPGSTIQKMGTSERTVVGYDGLVYITARPETTLRLVAQWPAGACRASIAIPLPKAPINALGRITCVEANHDPISP